MRVVGASLVLGALFGFLLAWGGMSNPDTIRSMLLLDDAYLFLVLGSSMAVASLGIRLLRRRGARAYLTRSPVSWETGRGVERRHVVGSAVFGLGWAIASTCPGPVAAQLGQGVFWSVFTIAGIMIGMTLHVRRATRARELEPDVLPGLEGAAG